MRSRAKSTAYNVARGLLVVAFLAATIYAFMSAPGPMALVAATELLIYWTK